MPSLAYFFSGGFTRSPVSNNDTGTVAFGADFSGGFGIFTGTGGSTTTIADTSGPFSSFGSLAINTTGTVAFQANLRIGGSGIFTGPDAEANKVIRIGDSLAGSTVTGLTFFGGFTNQGQIAFVATLADGTKGVFRAEPIIEAPKNLTARVGNGAVYLNWDPRSEPIDGFNIYIAQFNGTTFVPLGTVNQPGVLIQDSTKNVYGLPSGEPITNGELYAFNVTAKKNGLESAPSNFVLARPNEFAVSQPPSKRTEPILFLHGICNPITLSTTASTWDTTVDFLENTLHWTNGGTLRYFETQDPRLSAPSLSIFSSFGDFYAVTFGNCWANYSVGRPGLLHQADEVRGFIQRLRSAGVTNKLAIVAHSMGGMSARSYIADNPRDAVSQISQFVTYGSPHWGSSFSSLIQGFSQGAKDLDFDCRNGRIDYTGSPFMEHLRSVILPPPIQYSFIRGFVGFRSFTEGCLSTAWDGVIPADSTTLGQVPNSAPIGQIPLTSGAATPITTNHGHIYETNDFSAILCALDSACFIAKLGSPVDMQITAPDGRSINRQLTEIPGASYMEAADETGHPIATAILPFPLAGDYILSVVPKDGASPEDTYNLEIITNGITSLLAQNQRLQDIPTQPFTVKVPLQVTIDIKPGSGPNCINPTAKGTTTVAVLGKDFDVKTINVGTIRIDGDSNPATIGISPVSVTYGDVDKDRRTDLVLQFSTLQLNGAGMFSDGKTLYITGERTDGMRILGSDVIFFAGGPNCS